MTTGIEARLFPREPGNRRGRATADKLALAALGVAEAKGVAGATVDEICRVAGCSRRTFFHHFPSLDAALLGTAVPVVNPEAVARYLAEPVPILAGALELVEIPDELSPASPLGARRQALLLTSPHLQAAARERLMPAAAGVLEAVTAKVAQRPDLRPDEARLIAQPVVTMAAALIQEGYSDGTCDPVSTLRRLAPVWDQLVGPPAKTV